MKAGLTGAGLLLALLLGPVYSAQFPSARYPLPPNPSTIEGIVVDAETGKPLAGLTVIPPWPSSWPAPPPDLPLVFPLAQTEADGHFLRDNIFGDHGRASLSFYTANHEFRSLPFTIAPGQRLENIVIRLRPMKPKTGLITGRVVDETGKGIANVAVELYRPAPLEQIYDSSARTDDRGEFRLYGLRPGRYLVGYSAGLTLLQGKPAASGSVPAALYPGVGEVSRAEIVAVENDKEVRLKDTVIGPVRMGKLRVHVINRGEPAKDGSMDTGEGYSSVHIDANADFWREYSPMRPGRVSIVVKWANSGSPASIYSTTIVFDGTERLLEVDLSRIHGVLSIRTLIEQTDGSTVPFATNTKPNIGLKSRSSDDREANTRSSSASLQETFSGASMILGSDGSADFSELITGSYNLDHLDLPPALYMASARQGDRDALADGIDISSQPSILEIHLRQGAAVFRGTVSDTKGQPTQGASVLLIPELPQGEGHRVGMWLADVTDQNGHFEIPGIVPGRYRAYAALGVDWWGPGDHALTSVDPDFVATFRDRAIPVTLEENGELMRDLSLLTR